MCLNNKLVSLHKPLLEHYFLSCDPDCSTHQLLTPCSLRFTAPADFVDSMDSKNYIAVELQKPMGIVFEENDEDFGGIFVQALKEGGIAAAHGVVQPGDQLVAVDTTKVSGMVFDDALGKIVEAKGETTKLTLFRGSAKQFYGPTGASQAWLDEFVAGGSVSPSSA